MNEWQTITLEKACLKITDGSHYSPKAVEIGYPMLTVKDMRDYGFDYSSCKKISKSDFEQMVSNDCVPQKDDVLIAKDGSYLKHVFTVNESKEEAVLSSIAIFRPNQSIITSNYLRYFILNPRTKKLISDNYVSGSAIPRIVLKDFKKIKVKIPNIIEQKAIAHVLSTLDDKIEVNNQINKTLENMAQAIFKQWFVDFEFPNEDGEPYKSTGGEMVDSELGMIPKGWELKILGDVIDNVKEATKPGKHLEDRKYNPIDTLTIKSIAMNDYNSYEDANSSLVLFEKYDILIGAMRVYFHRVNLAPYKGITRTTTFVLRSKRVQDVAYNLFLLNMDETIDFAEKTSKGSTMPYAVWENGMSNLRIVHPTMELRNMFFEIIQPLLEVIMSRAQENRVLVNIRDTLLPKLMSGEIRVPIES